MRYLHLMGEFFLIFSFLIYIVYNVYTRPGVLVKALNYINQYLYDTRKLDNFFKMKNGDESRYSVGFFFSLKTYISNNRIFQYVENKISEKNSLQYVSFVCFIASIIFFCEISWFWLTPQSKQLFFESVYSIDLLSTFLKFLIVFCGSFFFFMCHHSSFFWKFFRYEMGFFIFTALMSMIFLVSSNDLFFSYLLIEVQTASIVVLSSFQITHKRSVEGGLKYFIYSSFSSAIFLISIAYIYLLLGTVNVETIFILTEAGTVGSHYIDNILIAICVFITFFIFFKLGVFPFHYWVSDVYEGSNIIVTAFLAIISKIGLVGLIIRLDSTIFISFHYSWSTYAYMLGISSMLLGGIVGLTQTNIKKLLAYTSIGNMGVFMLAVAMGEVDTTSFAVFYFSLYLFASACLFLLLIGAVYKNKSGTSEEIFNHINDIRDLQGLFKSNKLLSLAALFLLLNLIGMPVTSFFFGKYFIFDSLLRHDFMFGLDSFILFNILSAFIYLRIIKIIFLDRVSVNKSFFFISRKICIIFYLFILLNVLIFIYPPLLIPLVTLAQYAVKTFYIIM
jgi:NADH-quinone oxidoreductase subunit N